MLHLNGCMHAYGLHSLRLILNDKNTLHMFRCQAAPEGGAGKSLFNLRAWGANLVNSLLLGQEQKQRSEQQPSGDEAQQAESRTTDNGAPSKPAELRILPANAEEEAWELWKEVYHCRMHHTFFASFQDITAHDMAVPQADSVMHCN